MSDTDPGSDPVAGTDATPASSPAHDPYSSLRLAGFRRYLTGNLLSLVGLQMQIFTMEWEIFQRTDSNKAVGDVGLVSFLPVLFLALPAGHMADRFSRRGVILVALSLLMLGACGMAAVSYWQLPVSWMYGCIVLSSIGRAIQQPAKASIVPQIVGMSQLRNAVTWNASIFHFACVAGPGVAGFLLAYGLTPAAIYGCEAVASVVFGVLLMTVDLPPRVWGAHKMTNTWHDLLEGLRFVWRTKLLLGCISLDLFAVLFGGATALLPAYAKYILMITPDQMAELRFAPAVGALAMSFTLAHLPPMERAGRAMLWAVAGFGVATIVFGLSRNFWLSLGVQVLAGAFDMISVVVRHTLVQLLTPEEMRGRVSAVNSVFIGASNELGAWESGYVAEYFERSDDRGFGPTMSCVIGGLGTLGVVATVAVTNPEIRRFGRLERKPE